MEVGTYIPRDKRAKYADELKNKYEAGATVKELANETGRSDAQMYRLLREAGTKMRGGRPRRKPDEKRARFADELKNKYEAGATVRALANETGHSSNFVNKLLTEAETKMRKMGNAGRRHKTDEKRAKVAAELKTKYESGASLRTLAEEIGRSPGFVGTLLIEYGVTLRKPRNVAHYMAMKRNKKMTGSA